MTKKAKYLFLTIATLFLAACVDISTPTPNATVTHISSTNECTFPVDIIHVADPAPGDKVYLAPAVENSFGWRFDWQADDSIELQGSDTLSPSLIVPENVGQISITLEAIDGEGCVGRGKLLINVATQLDVTVETSVDVVVKPILTATQVVTATPEPMAVPTETSTATPTPEPTATPTATATPTIPPAQVASKGVTAVPLANPIITYYEILPGNAVRLIWEWEGELNPDQNFAVRFWSKSDPRPEARFSITWTQERTYQFGINDYPPGEYYMNVAVMIGPSVGEHYEVFRSEDVLVYVPPVEPTLPPP